MMQIQLNGETLQLPAGTSIAALLDMQALGDKRIAVERNGNIIVRSAHADTVLHAGDIVEIVTAVGGG